MKVFLVVVSAFFMVFLVFVVVAINTVDTGFRLTSDYAPLIDAHSICKVVLKNGSSNPDVFIPTRTANEWSSFLNNHPSFVNLLKCPNLEDLDIHTPGGGDEGSTTGIRYYYLKDPNSGNFIIIEASTK